jgi:putative sterol carrier protein
MAMNRHLAEAMAGAPRTGYDARLSGLQGTICFKVQEIGSWRLRIEDGHFHVLEGSGEADLILSLDEETFIEVIEGRQNFITGLLRGRVRAEGDLALALKFHGIFPRSQAPSDVTSKEVHP